MGAAAAYMMAIAIAIVTVFYILLIYRSTEYA